MERKVEVRHMENSLPSATWNVCATGAPTAFKPGSLHLDILRDLKRINAHIVSVAHPIMDEQGLLGESRLIAGGSAD